MRHHLLAPSCVAALVLAPVSFAALASAVQSGAGTIDVSFEHSGSHNFPSASFPVTFPGFSFDGKAGAAAESIDDPTDTIPPLSGTFPIIYSDDGYPLEYGVYTREGLLPAGSIS